MDEVDLTPQIEQLGENIDNLEEVLGPLLKNALSDTAANLPLLDKAKLYVLIVYSIESLLFSYLKLNDVDAKNHPVFRELTRVKQYYEKIAEIEKPQEVPKINLSRGAAGRIIRHALAGNTEYDRQRKEQQELSNATAQIKLTEMSNKRKYDGEEVEKSKKRQDKKGKKNRNQREEAKKLESDDHQRGTI